MPIPKIVIVGRPNVGKSSILNLLARRTVAIVDPTAGVTRDRVAITVEIPSEQRGVPDHHAQVIDTGGFGITDLEVGDHGNTRDMTADVEYQIDRGLRDADLVLFVTDAQTGVTALDERFVDILRKKAGDKAKLTIANKVDSMTIGMKSRGDTYHALRELICSPKRMAMTKSGGAIQAMRPV